MYHLGTEVRRGDVRNFDSPPSCWNLGENKETGDENILHAFKHVLQGSTVGRACLFKVWASAETPDVLKRDLHSSKNLSPNSLPRHIPHANATLKSPRRLRRNEMTPLLSPLVLDMMLLHQSAPFHFVWGLLLFLSPFPRLNPGGEGGGHKNKHGTVGFLPLWSVVEPRGRKEQETGEKTFCA